jgi:hypothetical protein
VPDVDIDEIVTQLNERVAERRAAGDYPVGLEMQLDSEFKDMLRAVERSEIDTHVLQSRLEGVRHSVHNVSADVGVDSRAPGGAAAHSAAGRIVKRHTGPLAESVREMGSSIANALDETRRLFDAQRSADERQLLDALSGVLDRLAVLDQLSATIRSLEARVARLETDQTS